MKINKYLFISISISLALILIRVKMTHQITYMFLIWNLFLAAIPFLISQVLLHHENYKKSKIVTLCLLGIWLLFLPNAPYLITDFLHLNHINDQLFWFDVALLIAFSVSGIIFCIHSLLHVHQIIQQLWSTKIATYAIIICSFLSGFGVYLGRYLRFNTWDILSNPTHLIISMIHSLSLSKTWIITFSFGWLLTVLFLFTKKRLLVS